MDRKKDVSEKKKRRHSSITTTRPIAAATFSSASFNQKMVAAFSFGRIAFGEVLGLNLSLCIPFSHSGLRSDDGKVTQRYVVFCTLAKPSSLLEDGSTPPTPPLKSWEVTKDLADFHHLDKKLRRLFSSPANAAMALQGLPGKRIFTPDSDLLLVGKRKRQLLEYMQNILACSVFEPRSQEQQGVDVELARFLHFPGIVAAAASSADGQGHLAAALIQNQLALSSSQEEPTALEGGTALKVGADHHGFLFLRGGNSLGLGRALFGGRRRHRQVSSQLVFCVLNVERGTLQFCHPYTNEAVLGETKIQGKYGKITLLDDFRSPAAAFANRVSGIVGARARGLCEAGFGFSLWVPPGEELVFYAETREDRHMWMSALRGQLSTTVPHVPQNPYSAKVVVAAAAVKPVVVTVMSSSSSPPRKRGTLDRHGSPTPASAAIVPSAAQFEDDPDLIV